MELLCRRKFCPVSTLSASRVWSGVRSTPRRSPALAATQTASLDQQELLDSLLTTESPESLTPSLTELTALVASQESQALWRAVSTAQISSVVIA